MNLERDRSEYIAPEKFKKVVDFARDKKTPCVIMDVSRVEEKYDELTGYFPYAKIFFAVKANPNDDVLSMLVQKGAFFDVATIYEINQMLRLGANPEKMSFGNTIKKEVDIAYAYSKGIRLFATDAPSDIEKIARQAPGAKVFFRIIRESESADWPLSRKFGAHPDVVFNLALQARDLGLVPYGISFHVGSQQRDIGQWDDAIGQCKYLFDALKNEGIELKMMNMGGGFPSNYIHPTHNISVYAKEITRYLQDDFGDNFPEIILEPGRSLVADAGVLVSEVVMIARKSEQSMNDWVFVDIGKFGGLIETTDESIKYPIFTEDYKKGDAVKEVIIAGPTCDSADILYEKNHYKLPANLKEGDRLYFLTTGAYTQSYSAIYFNGFPPLDMHILPR